MPRMCAAAILIFLSASSVASGQTLAAKSLRVILRTDKTHYRTGATVHVECELKNAGEKAIFVSSELAVGGSPGCRPGGLWIEAFDGNGKRSYGEYGSYGDCAAPTSTPHLVQLDKGQFFGVDGSKALGELVPGPGAYKLVLHYIGPVSEYAPEEPQPFPSDKTPSVVRDVTSAPVLIRVLPVSER